MKTMQYELKISEGIAVFHQLFFLDSLRGCSKISIKRRGIKLKCISSSFPDVAGFSSHRLSFGERTLFLRGDDRHKDDNETVAGAGGNIDEFILNLLEVTLAFDEKYSKKREECMEERKSKIKIGEFEIEFDSKMQKKIIKLLGGEK